VTATVYVIDDDDAVRDALGMMLRAAGFGADTFASALCYLERPRASPPGCLVLDVRMPGMSGLELQEKLAHERTALPIVFLTGHGDVPMAVKAVKRGAFDFIQKPVEERHLLAVVEAAVEHSTARASARAVPEIAHGFSDRLSRREREVLAMILAGKQTRAIADGLFISIKTVEFHRARIHQKLGVASMAELFSVCLGGAPGTQPPAASNADPGAPARN